MEKNCLLTTYKATVDNPELKVLGELVMKFKNVLANGELISLQNNTNLEYVKIDKNVKTSDGTVLPAGILPPDAYKQKLYSIEAGDYTLRIKSKYDIVYLYSLIYADVDMNDFTFSENITNLVIRANHTGNKDIKLPNNFSYIDIGCDTPIPVTELIKNNTTVCRTNCAKGDIKDVKDLLPNITILALTNSKGLYGDFKWLGLVNSNEMGAPCVGTSLAGNVEDFVAIRRENGQTSGEVTFNFLGASGLIKFKGARISNIKDNTLSWDETTITFNGDTITA